MGLPVSDDTARSMEITFGSTQTINPVSTKRGFCDEWDAHGTWDEEPAVVGTEKQQQQPPHADTRLACLDDILTEIETSKTTDKGKDPWEHFPALRALMRERKDWDTDFRMIEVALERCQHKEKSPCANATSIALGPDAVEDGEIFRAIGRIWNERHDPLATKREQLRESFWDTAVPNILNATWERPLVKHVILAYGVDIPTEVGYVYKKKEKLEKKNNNNNSGNNSNNNNSNQQKQKQKQQYDGIPTVKKVLWETAGGAISQEKVEKSRGGIADLLAKKRPKREAISNGSLKHSGDGSVPYLSLSWAHTWLLHAVRALRHSSSSSSASLQGENPLDSISISHRPKGATVWKDGPPPPSESGEVSTTTTTTTATTTTTKDEKKVEESSDTGTAHPHGTKYKPEMIRYHSTGTSRTTGIEYTTTVIEAIGVEHKETTRNYDILAAVFTDVLRKMHDDLNIV